MSGRRYLIHASLLIPDTAPASTHACKPVEEKIRKFYRKSAVAIEYEQHPEVAQIITTLKSNPLSREQLQYLLDKSHDEAVPEPTPPLTT